MSKLLNDKDGILIFSRDLANIKDIGINGAIVLQQFHYWIEHNKKGFLDDITHDKYSNIYQAGKFWTYGSKKKWLEENFTFWSMSKLKRVLDSLIEKEYLIIDNFNSKGYDQTLWYTINYEKLEKHEREIENLKAQRELNKLKKIQEKNRTKVQKNIVDSEEKSSKTAKTLNSSKWTNGKVQNELMDKFKMSQPIQKINTKDLKKDLSIVVYNVDTNVNNSQMDDLLSFINGAFKKPMGRTNTKKFKAWVNKVGYDYVKRIIQYCYYNKFKTYNYFESVIEAYVSDEIICAVELNKRINKDVDNMHKRAIKNTQEINPFKFNNFEAREYDYEDLEKRLLGWA